MFIFISYYIGRVTIFCLFIYFFKVIFWRSSAKNIEIWEIRKVFTQFIIHKFLYLCSERSYPASLIWPSTINIYSFMAFHKFHIFLILRLSNRVLYIYSIVFLIRFG